MPKILVIEDEPEIADSIRRGLVLKGFEVDVALTGHQGLDIAQSTFPDLVILDLMLPDADGIDICRELRASGDIGIVILTARTVVGERVRGLEAGADDYVPKPFAFEELLARIQALLKRDSSPGTEQLIKLGELEYDKSALQVNRAGVAIKLTAKELQVLDLLLSQPGKVFSRERILANVWGMNTDPLTNVVDVYVRRLRRKIDDDFSAKYIQTFRGVGYSISADAVQVS